VASTLRGVEFARQVLELAAQFIVLENLFEARRLELLDSKDEALSRNQVAQLHARLDRFVRIVGDPHVVSRLEARFLRSAREHAGVSQAVTSLPSTMTERKAVHSNQKSSFADFSTARA